MEADGKTTEPEEPEVNMTFGGDFWGIQRRSICLPLDLYLPTPSTLKLPEAQMGRREGRPPAQVQVTSEKGESTLQVPNP